MTNPPPVPEGYGHLPGPPQQGYGQPQQGNPYAQQPQQAQQPPYPQQQPQQPAYPQQPPQQPPGYGYPPPVPPGPPQGPGNPAKRKLTILIAAAVAGVLVIGTGSYFAFFAGDDEKKTAQTPSASPSGDAKPGDPSPSASVDDGDGSGNGAKEETDLNAGRKPGEDKVLWLKTNEVELPGNGAEAPAQWIVGDTVVKAVYKSVTAYGVTDGKQRWSIPFTGVICSAINQSTQDGKTVVAFKNGDTSSSDCNQLKQIDLKAGKEGWTKEVPEEGLFDIMTSVSLAITGDTLTVSRMGTASAFKVSTGDKLFGRPAGGCKPSAYAGGGTKLIAVAGCGDETEELQGVDPATGKPAWSFKFDKGWAVNKVYSTDPVVVVDVNKRSTKERAIAVFGPDGKKRTHLTGEGKFSARCGMSIFSGPQSCQGVVVDASTNTMYMPTEGTGNEIVAFDLGTGKVKWRVPAGERRSAMPLKAENGRLIAYLEPGYEQGGEVVSYAAGGGQPTTLLRNPAGASAVERTFFSPRVDYADGRLFLSATRLSGRSEGPEKFLMVFGK
ncbi:PQQ-binding-like beta-propeller repeat protein [Streptomyces sp. NPDC051211]|uniref:outer membrane protein assembly factor BamB family protein n=1 Tax=Streptomyces sp. NPDC051211 TaxID=3154643 RepID=UPI00344C0575